ncbi:hypothetical protein EDC30_109123 [Paucimonas lemoignei]|uniref:DUF7673 domain-containing protein n=1 Tax=Paucimonas lemoignei TaxID=29443 RepID=A0A4R3HT13_PAULE|nr:hypothetical protein [Paucimonas lemoignei]TCS35824.1 hypothetical protein EDC30_109123 [Paucimonas lemoignei]
MDAKLPPAVNADDACQQSAFIARIRAQEERRLQAQAEGLPALRRLLPIARRDTGQSRVIAHFLLSLYNGNRFKMDLTDLRGLDQELFEDCLAVLRMDNTPQREVHCYFENGGAIWEKMASDWNVTDYRLQRIELQELKGAAR